MALEVAGSGVRVNAGGARPDRYRDARPLHSVAEDGKSYMKSLVPMNRLGKPDEVAQAIGYLSSKDASFITGQILGVDGGTSAG